MSYDKPSSKYRLGIETYQYPQLYEPTSEKIVQRLSEQWCIDKARSPWPTDPPY